MTQHHHTPSLFVPTMSSLELVEIINRMRAEGAAELRHDNFMAKIEKHPGITSPKFLGHVEIRWKPAVLDLVRNHLKNSGAAA